ncbi:MAG: TonB-dependent receptor [Saprospiraceae bacterium]
MIKRVSLLFFVICNSVNSQQDSLYLKEVSITATRSERLITSIPLPFQVLNSNTIHLNSSVRLQDVLSEQAGLSIVPQVNGLGNGIQIQGLNPDYTLILIDGEPLIGRYTGSLELSRISTGNIKKIEIVKGPSSSLYGSDALAGVINIITDQAYSKKLNLGIQCSSRNTWDLNALGSYSYKKWRANAFVNRFSSNGYDLSPDIYGQTVSPFTNYTLSSKLFYTLNSHHEFQLNFRQFNEYQNNHYQVINAKDSIKVEGKGIVEDWNVNPIYKFICNPRLALNASYYYSQYKTKTELNGLESQTLFYKDKFNQKFNRLELIGNFKLNSKNKFVLGLGNVSESIQSSRYGDENAKKQNTEYTFIQHEWEPTPSWNIITGFRIDNNSAYSMQWSPKFAMQYKVNSKTSVKFSIGTGFKAPDFRQLYLNFNNEAASYSVYGTQVVVNELLKLKDQNLLDQIYIPLDNYTKIDAESSLAFNMGLIHQLNKSMRFDFNLFRNDLEGLIETQIVATTKNQRNIYSYTNIKRAYTTGIETNFSYTIFKKLNISLGVQYLLAKDKNVESQVRNGQIYHRDPITLETYKIKSNEYFGLSNRSRNQLSLKLNYTIPKMNIDLSCRFIYRSKFGLSSTSGNVSGITVPQSDINSNGILDKYDLFVNGYTLTNITLGKKLGELFEIQIGSENVSNYKDPVHIPNLVGRNLFINLHYKLIKS